MTRAVAFHPSAQLEADDAYRWYDGQRSGLGEEFLAALREAVDRIQANTMRYAQVHGEVRRALTRRFPYGDFFRADPDRIVVLAVFHCSRDPQHWRGRQ